MMRKISALALAIVLGLSMLSGCSRNDADASPDFSGVRSACELSSLQCYFHNVAKVTSPTRFLGGFGAAKHMWMEYDGVVKYGIDVSQVKIYTPDDQGVVKISVPEAEVLSVYLDTDSIEEPITDGDKLPWNKFKTEDKTKAIAEAQSAMKRQAEENTTLIAQASDRAKSVLEGYVKNVGRTIGVEYEVEWV